MTSYLAMFPPSLPHYFIEKYTKPGDIVYDPFCGRGTSVLEGCRLGRVGVGNDLSPLAFCLSKAKSDLPKPRNVLKRLRELNSVYSPPSIHQVDPNIKMLFDASKTLPQLVYLKDRLNISRSKVDNFIMALLTGIMHGKHRKSGSSIYCSIDMPNTFSFSPAYIKKYIAKHHLKAPCQDVFVLLEQRLDHLFSQPVTPLQCLSKYTRGYCFQTDAIKSSKRVLQKFGKNSVALIVTSPPYLKNISYAKFNWIRLWLFKKSQKAHEFRDNLAFKPYATYLHKLFNSWAEILKPGGRACVVIGDVHEQKLALDVWEFGKTRSALKLETIMVDTLDLSSKTTRIWGNKKGRATKIDRILVLQKE